MGSQLCPFGPVVPLQAERIQWESTVEMTVCSKRKPTVLLFTIPFASEANANHIDKLVHCLAPNCESLYLLGDSRVASSYDERSLIRLAPMPTLHYFRSIQPAMWSLLLWAVKLVWIQLRGIWTVFSLRRQVDMVICYKGSYYTPILFMARIVGMRAINYLPNNESAAAALHYRSGKLRGILVGMLSMLQKVNQRIAHICVVQSFHLVEKLGLHIALDKVRLGPLYVDTDSFTDRVPHANRERVVGFVGRLNPEKGVAQFLQAAASLRSDGIRFVVVGDGPLRSSLEEQMLTDGITNVELTGWVGKEDLIRRLNTFKLLVMPTQNEGLPNVMLESMACAVPVAAMPIDGIPDLIVDRQTGFFLSDVSPKTIALTVCAALDHPELTVVANQAKAHVRSNWSRSIVEERWKDILNEQLQVGGG